ncbi:MAG: GatB/YqeY domain-containing protein, partial [Anaerolineae bacterium]|nr:GatB/YqeY domain-containing protein [Anaerolineae bacterium]
MNPKQQIQQDLKAAMKSGDADRRQVLRMLMAAFKQVEVDTREELTDSDVMDVLMSEVKKHREAIADMEKAGRLDQIEEEQYAL